MENGKSKIQNERGVMKFIRGSMYDGVFEVLPYNMEDEDVVHCIGVLMEHAATRNLKLPTLDPHLLDNEKLIALAVEAVKALEARGQLTGFKGRVAWLFPASVVRVELSSTEQALVETGRKIAAIKELRARTGMGLKDAKDQCDAYQTLWEKAGKPHGGLPSPL